MLTALDDMAKQKGARNNHSITLGHGDVAKIAREIGRSRSHVWRVIARQRDSKTVADEVSRVVGVPFERIHLAA